MDRPANAKNKIFLKQPWQYVRWFLIKAIDYVYTWKNSNFKIFDFSSPGGVLRVLFFAKLATRCCSKPLQVIFWHRIVAHVFASILIPNFGPAGTRVMWFQPFENGYSVEKSEKFSKNFWKRNKIFSKSIALAYRGDFESF